MTVFTLGEAAAAALGSCARPRAGGVHRTGQPVRRNSAEEGSFEGFFFVEPGRGECDRLLRAARAALDAGRRLKRAERAGGRALTGPERALAALSAGAVRVYEELLTLARLNRGRVYPGYDRLADATALGRATVARALNVLEAAGFLVRQRRFRRVEGEGAGPRYAQCSNAYRPIWPAALAELLPRRFRPAPLPPCEESRAAEQAAGTAAMRATLTCRELAAATVGGVLGRVLARLGARLDTLAERESHAGPEPLNEFIDRTLNSVGLDGRHDGPDGHRTMAINRLLPNITPDAPAAPARCSLEGAATSGFPCDVDGPTYRQVEQLPSRPVVP